MDKKRYVVGPRQEVLLPQRTGGLQLRALVLLDQERELLLVVHGTCRQQSSTQKRDVVEKPAAAEIGQLDSD